MNQYAVQAGPDITVSEGAVTTLGNLDIGDFGFVTSVTVTLTGGGTDDYFTTPSTSTFSLTVLGQSYSVSTDLINGATRYSIGGQPFCVVSRNASLTEATFSFDTPSHPGGVSDNDVYIAQAFVRLLQLTTNENAHPGPLTVAYDVTGAIRVGNFADPSMLVYVANVNDAPVFTGATTPSAVATEDAPGGVQVSLIVPDAAKSDPDGAADSTIGIAITAASGSGTWQYFNGSAWVDISTVGDNQALLLNAADPIRFVGTGGNAGQGQITYRLWDGTTSSHFNKVDTGGGGGASAFSAATQTFDYTRTELNDAPVVTNTTPTLTAIDEENTASSGQLVSDFLSASDADASALSGIAVVGQAGNGHWEYSTDGSNWVSLAGVSEATAMLLLTTDYVRFVPDTLNGGAATLTFRAWDQTNGLSAHTLQAILADGGTTAYSANTGVATLNVTPVNDVPTASNLTRDFIINEDTPTAAFNIQVTDVDIGDTYTATLMVADPAVGSLSSTGGGIYDSGTGKWTVNGSLATVNAALAAVKFTPALNANINTTITTHIRDAADTGPDDGLISITVTPVNDAPALASPSPTLAAITEDDVDDTGMTVADLVGTTITDGDAGALKGIAITGLAGDNGVWEYSRDGGNTWDAIGSASDASALLLDVSDRVRFNPDGENGTTATLDYRAWDHTFGQAGDRATIDTTGGATAFSADTNTATLVVENVNDVAEVTVTDVASTETKAGPDTHFFIADKVAMSDVDLDDAIQTLYVAGSGSVTLIDGPAPPFDTLADYLIVNAATGEVTYSRSAFNWLKEGQCVTYTITFEVKSGDDDPQTVTLDVTIDGLNDAPVLTWPNHQTFAAMTEDDAPGAARTVLSFRGPLADDDYHARTGIAITDTYGNGEWQYSVDGGNCWICFDPCPTEALLLRDSDLVRFVPDGENGGEAGFTYRAWDRSEGRAGCFADTTTNGGTTPFSTAKDTVTLQVASINDAPVITPDNMTLLDITEDETANAGQPVWTFLCDAIDDVDNGAVQGIALTGTTNGNGHWEYSLDGGTTWASVGARSESAALLLREDDWMRFVPDGKNGTTATLTYHAWDQTTGDAGDVVDLTAAGATGGTTAYSTDTDTVSIDVSDVNDAPAISGTVTLMAVKEDTTRAITKAELLGNTVDVDTGATLSVLDLTLVGAGTLTDNGNDTWSFKPAQDDDTSVSFTYKVSDGIAAAIATSATLDITPVNDAPQSANDIATGNEDTTIGGTVSATDVDSQGLTYSLFTQAAHGVATVNANGTYTYKPNANYNGPDSFVFQTSDGLTTSLATISLVVNAINDAPTNTLLASLTVEAGLDIPVTGLAMADVDAGTGNLTTTLSVLHGTLKIGGFVGTAISGNGTSTVTLIGTLAQINAALAAAKNVTYHTDAGFTGSDTLKVVTTDNGNVGAGGVLSDIDQMNLSWQHVQGDGGNNSFTALAGYERIDAGSGIDTVTFGFKLTDATITWVGNQVIIDTATSHTTLTGVEVFSFTDGTVNNNDGDALVDDLFYYSTYRDIWAAHVDADAHYHSNGWHEWRDPNAFFSTLFYLTTNADVRASGADPLTQFHQAGWAQGRVPSIAFDTAAYIKANPDVAAAHIDPLAHFLQSGAGEGRVPIARTELIAPNGFDYIYYLQHNPDVAAAHVDPLQHFQTSGWKEGRNPNALFDTNGYLATYGDVKAAGINPLDHYHANGWKEGRDPSPNFDSSAYLAAYADVRASGIDPLVHYLQAGIHEGRSPFADGVWG